MSHIVPSNSKRSKVLYIDSRDANSYLQTNELNGQPYHSYFQYILKEHIEVPQNQRALISLHSATIPYSFYNLRQGINDLIPLRLDVLSGGVGSYTGNLTVAPGNYNVFTLATYLQTEIPKIFASVITFTIKLTFNQTTQKYTWSMTGTGGDATKDLELTLDFRAGSDKIQDTLTNIETGWRYREVSILYAGDKANSGRSDIFPESDNVIDINGSIHGVYIRTNIVSDSTLDSQNGTFSNILSRIPINVQSGGLIFSTPANEGHKSIVDLRYLNAVTIRLTDERNRLIDLNGLHFQLAITIDFIYGEKPIDIREGALSKNPDGDSYAVDINGGQISREAVIRARLENEEFAERSRRNPKITATNPRGAGRPRKVGRPKG